MTAVLNWAAKNGVWIFLGASAVALVVMTALGIAVIIRR